MRAPSNAESGRKRASRRANCIWPPALLLDRLHAAACALLAPSRRPNSVRQIGHNYAVAALAALLVSGCATGRLKVGAGKEGEVIEAEGWAPIDSKDPIGTRQRSLADAQKKAVERVVGVYISAQTRVEQAISVDQKILAKVDGYIQKYDVLKEKDEDGFHKTTIRALVLYKKVGDDLKQLGLVRPKAPPGNPKIAVIIRGKDRNPDDWGPSASAALQQALLEKGFSVVDLKGLQAEAAAIKSADPVSVAAAGLKLHADLMATGEAEAYPLTDARLGDFASYRARIVVQVVKTQGGEILSRKSQEASAIDPAPKIAAAKAMENAGQLAGEALGQELSSLLKSQIGITLRVSGLGGLSQVQRFSEDLRMTPGIAGVSLSVYQEPTAELSITTDGMTGDQLAAEALRMQRYKLRAVNVTPYEVDLEGS